MSPSDRPACRCPRSRRGPRRRSAPQAAAGGARPRACAKRRAALIVAAAAAAAVAWGAARVAELDRRVARSGAGDRRPHRHRAALGLAGGRGRLGSGGDSDPRRAGHGARPGRRLPRARVAAARSMPSSAGTTRPRASTSSCARTARWSGRAAAAGCGGRSTPRTGTSSRASGAAPAPSPARALVAGIAVGDTSGLPYSERQSLRASGLYHVVAVSGQNVALLIAFTLVALGVAASSACRPVSRQVR